MTGYVGLNLLTETRVSIGQYGGHSEVLVPLMAVVYKCQTHTTNTGGNCYGQPQDVAERCDVASPCYVVFLGFRMNTLVLEWKFTVFIRSVRSDNLQIWLHLTKRLHIMLLSLLKFAEFVVFVCVCGCVCVCVFVFVCGCLCVCVCVCVFVCFTKNAAITSPNRTIRFVFTM